ncbi:MAG: acyl-CoA dehydrogenase [Porticoccaceae bacterium]
MIALLVLVLVVLILGFAGTNLPVSAAILALLSLILFFVDAAPLWVAMLSLVTALVLTLLSFTVLRSQWLSRPLFRWFCKIAPTMSNTEREALEAGTLWWDAELFSGNPDWNRLLTAPKPVLSKEEQAFIDGPVEELCAMLNDWQILHDKDLPPQVWDFLRSKGFFSLIIDKAYGGLGFSAYGNSAVVAKIASCNLTAAVTVMVPNSLGPGELLRDFGTKEQQDYYLPRLASGEEIPCFALTGPTAGSDAASMPDTGIVCKGEWQGNEVLGLRVSWNKRYITLAPVATVVGLAFNTRDPDHLLGEEKDLGISCALIPTNTPGVWTGNRHLPVGSAFMNGPTKGDNVFIPMDYIIGGQARIGQGWRMLMHSLAAGRAISLPALGTAGVKLSARYSGEYARIRKQFGLPVAYFEGVEEVLARLAAEAYRVDAARMLTLSGLALGEKPAVLSAILKYYATEANRRSVNDAMDIHGGKGIITGSGNYLASMYQSLPIAITVEGANILTRSLIIFGQGAIRNHPYLQEEISLSQQQESTDVIHRFDQTLFAHVGFVINNLCRSIVFGLGGSWLIKTPVAGATAHHYRQLTRLSSVFAFVADAVLLSLGGSFKFKEKISGRLADVITHLYLASAILKHYEDSGCPEEDLPLVNWGISDSLYQAQNALIETLRNFPSPWLGRLINWLIFPLGAPFRAPRDALGKTAAKILYTENAARHRICEGLYQAKSPAVTGKLNLAFLGVLELNAIEKLLKDRLGEEINLDNFQQIATTALEKQLISSAEADRIVQVYGLVRDVINVDDFPADKLQ